MDSDLPIRGSKVAGARTASGEEKPILFGQRTLQHFEFDPTYRNLNHGKISADGVYEHKT